MENTPNIPSITIEARDPAVKPLVTFAIVGSFVLGYFVGRDTKPLSSVVRRKKD